jgi:ParB family chromosome partitioning protein
MTEKKTKKVESFASIFGDDYDPRQEQDTKEDIAKLLLDDLVAFEDHPFKLYEGDRLADMIESIKNLGVIVPIVVRKKGHAYEILSGHNRVNAARLAGLTDIPAVIKEGLTEDEAILIVTETNMMQRSFADLSHSERATVIATRHSAMKSQGVRNDLLVEIEKLSKAPDLNDELTSRPLGEKLNTDQTMAKEYGISARNISRYLRLNDLNPNLKKLVDKGQIAMRAGVDLSYMSEDNQEMVDAIVSENTFKVDMKKAATLKAYDKSKKLTWDKAVAIITGTLSKKEKKPTAFKVQPSIISKYFKPSENKKDIEETIEKALELYFSQVKEQTPIEQDEGEEMIE